MNTRHRPRVAFIHATWAAAAPITQAMGEEFPDAQIWHLLDDRLQEDALEDGMSTALQERMFGLIGHAFNGGADAVQLTCSMYSGLAAEARERWQKPVYGPDEALQEAVRESGAGEARVVFSWPQACTDGTERMKQAVSSQAMAITGVVAEGAAAAVARHDNEELLRRLQEAVGAVTEGTVIALGQYSLSPVSALLAERTGAPVLAGPVLAARQLRSTLRQH